jgi:hypothetical protein
MANGYLGFFIGAERTCTEDRKAIEYNPFRAVQRDARSEVSAEVPGCAAWLTMAHWSYTLEPMIARSRLIGIALNNRALRLGCRLVA